MVKKPFSAVTVLIERLTTEEYSENDLGGLPDLIEAVKLQDSGPSEASRAIRKKLKYGNVHRQLRALTLLDALIANAGRRFQRSFADEPLLERLRIAATSPTTDPDVRAKLKELFAQWAREYKDTNGLSSIAILYKQFPARKKPTPKPLVTDSGIQPSSPTTTTTRSPSTPSSSSPRPTPSRPVQSSSEQSSSWGRSHKKTKSRSKSAPFNLEKEKPQLTQTLANASVASTNLTNALKLINREKERPSEKPEVVRHYENCKSLRSATLRYIQHIESEQWLGSLIHSHEDLTMAVEMYEAYDKPIDEDSDSEDDEWNFVPSAEERMGRLKISGGEETPPPMPPRPMMEKGKSKAWGDDEEEEEDDPDDPFGNQYQIVDVPGQEEPGHWKVV